MCECPTVACHGLHARPRPRGDQRSRRPRVRRLRRQLLGCVRHRAPLPLGLLQGHGRRRLGRHRHPRGVRRRRARHHRGGHRVEPSGRFGRRAPRVGGVAPDDLRAQPGRQVRQRQAEGSVPPPRRSRRPACGIRRHRAKRRHRHIVHRDIRPPRRRPLHRARPQGMDHEGARVRARAAAGAHHAEGQGAASHRWTHPAAGGTAAARGNDLGHPEDGAQRGAHVRGRVRRPARARHGSCGRGRSRLQVPAGRAQRACSSRLPAA